MGTVVADTGSAGLTLLRYETMRAPGNVSADDGPFGVYPRSSCGRRAGRIDRGESAPVEQETMLRGARNIAADYAILRVDS